MGSPTPSTDVRVLPQAGARSSAVCRPVESRARVTFTEVMLPDPAGRGELGQTSSAPKPLLIDLTTAERELGFPAATTWGDALPRQVEWLIEATGGRDGRGVLPGASKYLQFDYERKDEFVASLGS